MTVRVDVSFKGFDRSPSPPPDVRMAILRALALACREIMHRRIRTGKDLTGSNFKPYSPGYAKHKAKKGRKVGAGKDWLVFSGRMLAAHNITELGSEHFVLGFVTNEEALKAWVNQAKYQRFFIGLTLVERNQAITATIEHARAKGWL